MIGFNKPYLSGKELEYISDSIQNQTISGNGKYTKMCQNYFKNRYGFKKCLLTTSCTDALEMAAILLNIVQGDEVIMPSFTFVSTANAFVLRGAKIIFADSRTDHPGIDENTLEPLITPRTKAIVVVHYAGVSCDMDIIMTIAHKYNLYVIEDSAQAIDSYYTDNSGKKRPLGSIGHLAAFSFHETKNIISGEGGMLVINDSQFVERAEIIWEKGTNRTAFYRGEVDKYGWVDIGSSFLPSDMVAAYLFAQLENLDKIQTRRKEIWQRYFNAIIPLADAGVVGLNYIPYYASNNAHMFYIVCKGLEERTKIIETLKKDGIQSVFHYQSLHQSAFYKNKHDGRILSNADHYSNTILRLPLYFELSEPNIDFITQVLILALKKN